jgi:enterochelin esterase-like enzyme
MPDAQGRGLSRSEADTIGALCALVESARRGETNLEELLTEAFGGDLSTVPELINRYGPVAASGEDFLFLCKSDGPAAVSIEGGPPQPMPPIADTGYAQRLETLRLGTTHNFIWHVGDQIVGRMGTVMPLSVAGYNPSSYPIPGAACGTPSEMRTITSRIYGGATVRYWVYTNPGIDMVRGAPLMIWLDGQNHVGLMDAFGVRMQVVTDNLVHRKRMPPMVHVLIAPGTGGTLAPAEAPPGLTPDSIVRSIQYDTVSDDFGRHLVEEVLPEVGQTVKLRQDGYSRAITGESSGGIAAFTLCWNRPLEFSRAYSTIGSYTALQWHPDRGLDGGYIYPHLIRREAKRNIRVWLSDGMNDIDSTPSSPRPHEHVAGSWPLGNLQMAQALKASLYDFHFRFGTGTHTSAQWALDLPESLAWLWRDYDPDKTEQTFEQEASERAKPLYRVQVVNRDAW